MYHYGIVIIIVNSHSVKIYPISHFPFPITNQYYNNDIIYVYIHPLVICYIAIEHDHRNSGFTQLEMVDLSIVCCKRFPEGIPWETGGMPENHPITNWCDIYIYISG